MWNRRSGFLVGTISLLSTGNCKIINLSEENILWGFKI